MGSQKSQKSQTVAGILEIRPQQIGLSYSSHIRRLRRERTVFLLSNDFVRMYVCGLPKWVRIGLGDRPSKSDEESAICE